MPPRIEERVRHDRNQIGHEPKQFFRRPRPCGNKYFGRHEVRVRLAREALPVLVRRELVVGLVPQDFGVPVEHARRLLLARVFQRARLQHGLEALAQLPAVPQQVVLAAPLLPSLFLPLVLLLALLRLLARPDLGALLLVAYCRSRAAHGCCSYCIATARLRVDGVERCRSVAVRYHWQRASTDAARRARMLRRSRIDGICSSSARVFQNITSTPLRLATHLLPKARRAFHQEDQ